MTQQTIYLKHYTIIIESDDDTETLTIEIQDQLGDTIDIMSISNDDEEE
jgi:hypothetical protein